MTRLEGARSARPLKRVRRQAFEMMIRNTVLLFFLLTTLGFSDEYSLKRHEFLLGPQVLRVERKRDGGTHQTGDLYGAAFTYDRLKRYGYYWGGEVSYAEGTLKGRSAVGDKLKSEMREIFAEVRGGYTFQQKCGRQISLTPYIGGGYFNEKNIYKEPSPITVHFETEFYYALAGALLIVPINSCFDIGINAKAKYLIDPKCHVSHDDDNDDASLTIHEEWQYRLEVPITYHPFECSHWAFSLKPFYERRHLGSQPNFPFDFVDTKYNIFGLLLNIEYRI